MSNSRKKTVHLRCSIKGKNSAEATNNQPIMFAKRISLKLFKIMPDGDPVMGNVLDSSYIYIPQNLDVNASDSIYIEGYSAYVNNYCNNTCSYTPIAIVVANYTVFPNNSSAIKNTRARKENIVKKRNRDAIGKKLKNNTARKIVY